MSAPIPYRTVAVPLEEPPDPELLVAHGLHVRARRVARFFVPPIILASVVLGLFAYEALTQVFLARIGAYEVKMVAMLSFGPTLTLGFLAATRAPKAFVARRKEQWLRELCIKHGCGEERVREFLSAL